MTGKLTTEKISKTEWQLSSCSWMFFHALFYDWLSNYLISIIHIAVNPFWEWTLVQSLWTCISLIQARVFCFFAGGSGILNSNWHMAVEGRSNIVQNTHAQLQTSLMTRFLSLLHWARQCAFGDGVCQLHIQQFFNLFAQFKTTRKLCFPVSIF